MNTPTLYAEAKQCLADIYNRFSRSFGLEAEFPLTDLRLCRAFAASVTETLIVVRGAESRLPPVALILAMIGVCREMINPPPVSREHRHPRGGVPRAFAHEMLDRLRAELPPTRDTALDLAGRIINEAGSLENTTSLKKAMINHRARLQGSVSSHELNLLVTDVLVMRYPGYALTMSGDPRRAA